MVLEVLRLEISYFIKEFNEKGTGLWKASKISKYAPGGAKGVNSKFRKGIFLENDEFQVGYSN